MSRAIARPPAALLSAALEATLDGVLVTDAAGVAVHCNHRFLRMWRLGSSPAELEHARVLDRCAAALCDPAAARARFGELLAAPEVDGYDVLEFPDGRAFERYSTPWRVPGAPPGRIWTHSDITERRVAAEAMRASEQRLTLTAQGANAALWEWDMEGGTVELSPRWTAMLGYPDDAPRTDAAEWLGRVHPADAQRVRAEIDRHLRGETPWFEAEYRARHADGGHRWIQSRGVAQRDAAGRATTMAGSCTDVSARQQAEERLRHLALHDALTGLPNRVLLRDRIARAARRTAPGACFAVLALNLDRFRVINESLGIARGDDVLTAVARRLEQALRPGDTVARVGADEFTLLVEDLPGADEVHPVAARVRSALALPIAHPAGNVRVTASLGIAIRSGPGAAADDVLREAGTALHRAKSRGRNRTEVFDASMQAQAQLRLRLESDLFRALEEGEFELHFQPIVALASGRATALEALVRWRHPERGLVAPGEFIAAAEETGAVVPLGRWVLRESCRQLAAWRALAPELRLHVNLSPGQLAAPGLVTELDEILRATGVPAGALTLEITESLLLRDQLAASMVLGALRDLGVDICVDDFGTGYSALSYLHEYPIGTLKIDRAFVEPLGRDARSEQLVRAILVMARALGMRVVAEGVETGQQLSVLRALGCIDAQGFLFARPAPAEEVASLLAASLPSREAAPHPAPLPWLARALEPAR